MYKSNMVCSLRGAVFLAQLEGIVPSTYIDSVGKPTFGIGRTDAAGGPISVKAYFDGMQMSDARLESRMALIFTNYMADLARYEAEVNAVLTVPVTQEQFDAMVSFHYNTGKIHKAAFVKTLNAGQPEAAAEQMLNWMKPIQLRDRRYAERDLFAGGEYPKTSIPIYTADVHGKRSATSTVRMVYDRALEQVTRHSGYPRPLDGNSLPVQPRVDWVDDRVAQPTAPGTSLLGRVIKVIFTAIFGSPKT